MVYLRLGSILRVSKRAIDVGWGALRLGISVLKLTTLVVTLALFLVPNTSLFAAERTIVVGVVDATMINDGNITAVKLDLKDGEVLTLYLMKKVRNEAGK